MSDQDFAIPTWLDNSFLEKVLQTKFKSESVQVSNFTVEVAIKKGDGFSSEMFRLVVESSRGVFKLLLKKPHESVEKYEFMNQFDLFNREILFYDQCYLAFKEILESINEFEEFAPEMFYCHEPTELLIIRDLRDEGFKTGDRVTRIPRQFAQDILRKLAKIHATSLALNGKWNGKLEGLKFHLYEGAFDKMLKKNLGALAKEAKTWGSDFEEIGEKLGNVVPDISTIGGQNVASNTGLNVLIHGDPWFNNLLLKKGEDPKALLIDFQTVSWGSLAIDLVYFMVTSLSEEDFADREELIREYHGHFERVLKKLKWPQIPTYEEVLTEFKAKFHHGLYSLTAKVITSVDPSEQSLEKMMIEDEDAVRRKFRAPRINAEAKVILKLLNEYGALDLQKC